MHNFKNFDQLIIIKIVLPYTKLMRSITKKVCIINRSNVKIFKQNTYILLIIELK